MRFPICFYVETDDYLSPASRSINTVSLTLSETDSHLPLHHITCTIY
jgi:hypothetical protein